MNFKKMIDIENTDEIYKEVNEKFKAWCPLYGFKIGINYSYDLTALITNDFI